MSGGKHSDEEGNSPLQTLITGEDVHEAGRKAKAIYVGWLVLSAESKKHYEVAAEALNGRFIAPLHARIAELQTDFKRLKDMDREIADDQDKEIARLKAEVERQEERIEALASQLQQVSEATVGEASAVFGFMGWLTTRDEVSGPFSMRHKANQAAELAGRYCQVQGWAIKDDRWFERLKQVPPAKRDIQEDQELDLEEDIPCSN
jgi:hypothetical protein